MQVSRKTSPWQPAWFATPSMQEHYDLVCWQAISWLSWFSWKEEYLCIYRSIDCRWAIIKF